MKVSKYSIRGLDKIDVNCASQVEGGYTTSFDSSGMNTVLRVDLKSLMITRIHNGVERAARRLDEDGY